MNVRTLFALSLLAVTASTASAQARSTTQGFHLGAGLNGSSIKIDSDFGGGETESGAGINFGLGYNFTPQFGILLSAAGANISGEDGDDYTLGQADLAGRFSFANPARAFVPYVEVGYTGISAQDQFEGVDVELSGTGFTGALGLNYFFNPKLALDVNARYTKGEFNTIKIDGESASDDDGLELSTGRFNIGVSWFPGGGR